MSEEYRNIAKDATQLAKELETQPRAVEYLSGIITDLFVDKHKFKGHNVRRPQLRSNSQD
jgi:Bardet-Biedl syndrome 7 protein